MKSSIFVFFIVQYMFLEAKAAPQISSPSNQTASLDDAANIDGFFDSITKRIGEFLKKEGYDPLYLQDQYAFNFSFKDLFHINWHSRLGLFGGEVRNLATIHRDGPATVEYDKASGALQISGEVAFGDIPAIYSFAAQAMNIGPRGTVQALVKDLRAHFLVAVFPTDLSMKLQEFELKDVSKIDVHVTGFGPLDPIASAISNVFTDAFKRTILKVVEQRVREQAANAIASFKPSDIG